MPHKRSREKLEERLAKQYVYKHSKTAHRFNDPNEIKEKCYIGTEEDITGAVLAKIRKIELKCGFELKRETDIPLYPQALVLSDDNLEGWFDVCAGL
jgi:hypothetical protein